MQQQWDTSCADRSDMHCEVVYGSRPSTKQWWVRQLSVNVAVGGILPAHMQHWVHGIWLDYMQCRSSECCEVQACAMQWWEHCSSAWWCRGLSCDAGIWGVLPADMRGRVQCVGGIAMQSWEAGSCELHSGCMRCFEGTCTWQCGQLHIESGIRLDMPANM